MKSTSHAWRAFTALILAAALGLVLQRVLQPKSFGELGHYRADSLYDILSQELIHQGRECCEECHKDISHLHSKDIHFRVQCEDCHGPGNFHVKHHKGDTSIRPADAEMPKEYTLEGCLFCHRRLSARPRTFAQIDPVEHYTFLHVIDANTVCIDCHSPHEPLFLLEEVSQARVHPIIYECQDCHDTLPDTDHKQMEGHPPIFTCEDCHPRIIKDFNERDHSFLRCTACHLFYRDSATSGRIFKNGSNRFCLLCHERKPFKDKQKVPQISPSDHIQEMAEVMKASPNDFADATTACLSCHIDFIHDSRLIEDLREHTR